MTTAWHLVCRSDEIDEEDLVRFDHDGNTYAVYNTATGFYATDGMCTHEAQHLEDGLVMDDVIECPLHQGRFHIPTGKARGAPVCIDLKTYPVKVEDENVFIEL